jgi:predicted nucleic acid-binding protein
MARLYFSVLTIGEIDQGIFKLPDGPRSRKLLAWRNQMVQASSDRILPVTLAVANSWAILLHRARLENRTLPVVDGLIAATAQHHDLTVVTRNARDFEPWLGTVINPWR